MIMNQIQCWCDVHYMHLSLNKVLLLMVGAILVQELKLGFSGTAGMAGMPNIYTFAQPDHYSNSLFGEHRSSSGHVYNHKNPSRCPDGPPSRWESNLDVASKAYLAPIVFNGKLISISEDYGGRIGATFRVQKQIKNSSSSLFNLMIGSHVTLYFVRNKLLKTEAPHCAIYINDNLLKLRPQEKYIVFASPPVTMFSNSVYMNIALNNNNKHQSLRPTANSHTVINLSAFAAPEQHNKRSNRQVRKVLCRRCRKFLSQ